MFRNRSTRYTPLSEEEKPEEIRIVLVGKTGAGKSATGNTILRRKAFQSKLDPYTVTTECDKKRAQVDGKTLYVVDTPGLFDPDKSPEELAREILTCISLAAPGPHVILVVLRPDRFTEEEQETVKRIQKMFGEEASHYTMALFTHGDDLVADGVSIEDFIDKSPDLRAFISQCGGGYHVFNNRDEDPSQVRELLEKINTMVQRNGGSCYTNEMLEEAERVIEEERERLMREDPNMTAEEARKRAENKNAYIKGALITALSVIGAATGAGVKIKCGAVVGGLVAGPVGAAVGAAAGLAIVAVIVAVKNKINFPSST